MPLRAFWRKLFPHRVRPLARPSTRLLESFPLAPYFPAVGRAGRPRWEELYGPLETRFPEHHEEVWWEVARFWVDRMHGYLGPRFHLLESYDCLLLTCLPPRRAGFLLESTDEMLDRMRSLLGSSALESGTFGPHVVVCFDDYQELQDHLVEFEPEEGESAAPAAVFIPGGCGHIAMFGDDLRMVEPTLVHELTHALLWHRGLPLWFEEGVAQVLPQLVVRSHGLLVDKDLHRRQREGWTKHGLRGFWDGSAFRHPDQAEHAYALAEVLVRSMLERKLNIAAFLANASWRDSGQKAGREHLKVEPALLARELFGVNYFYRVLPHERITLNFPCCLTKDLTHS